ncbi:MAG: SRPBCC domain-containing protein, partial [Myxococcota bacterium]
MEVVELHVSGLIPTRPDRLYAAWLDERDHASFTGGGPAQIEAKVGGTIVTGDGRYSGKITKLRSGTQISFTLRTPDFPEQAEDSKVTVSFDTHSDAETLIEIRHSKVPGPLGPELERHWLDHYVMPMRGFFAALPASPPPAPPQAAPEAKPPAAKATPAKKSTAPKSTGPSSSSADGAQKAASGKAVKEAAPKQAPANKAAAKKAPPKGTAAKKAPATKAAPKKAPPTGTAAKKAPAKKAAPKKAPAK